MQEHYARQEKDSALLQLVTFHIGDEEFGVEILKVQEIIRMMGITRVPKAPDFVEGVINLRGKVIPIIDLRKRFGLTAKEHEEDTRIMIIDIGGQTVGIIVDAVNEVVQMPGASIDPPPPTFILEAQYIEGIGKLDDRLVILLNIDRILTSQEAIQLKQTAQ